METATNYGSWPRQRPRRTGDQSNRERRYDSSWDAISRSRGRSAPCPRRWVICSQKILLQSDIASERSQFAAENKTSIECTFIRFFSTKHKNLRITVGRWLPKETPIRSAPSWEAFTSSRSQGEVHHDGGLLFFFPSGKN
ncbi:hypothetical protein Ddye_011157 [Dipteronia dyeriana]|uniref:Uncharacterized protein n=1 Tax=Dipteronia dyeriana TaxID=168575 RepID=A0AAE0CNV1_9ROSI|nr:hypothetical protein Ddye_011157 [Dipteronia dyeriana]